MRTVLMEALFDPRDPGPMQVLIDMNDSKYYEARAIEFIKETNLDYYDLNFYHDNIKKAIGLLTLARIKRNNKD